LPTLTKAARTIVERTTAGFRRDREELSPADQSPIQDSLKRAYALLKENRPKLFSELYQPLPIHLKGGLSSSLYALRAGVDIRIILTVDEDPIFGQTLATLFRAVRQRAYRSIAQLLYGGQLDRRNGAA
jgi:hypothetical protein